ncbi:MAG: ABC transporter substrate-binding protein [Sphingomonadales bacterium]|nr:ABC transporter substrate-binding protein [Sphingomonadales bacterium]
MNKKRYHAGTGLAPKLVGMIAVALASLVAGPALADSDPALVAAARREGRVVVYSVLSNKAAQPLIADFQAVYPGIEVDYDGDKGSTETDARFRAESAAGKFTADVVWSSAMDMQMKLVGDGFATPYRSPEAAGLPVWANYRNLAYATTQEPVVIVYNRDLLAPADVPRDHDGLAALLGRQPERLKGRITSFDIEKSGVGYMLAAQDSLANRKQAGLLAAFGRAGLRQSGGTGDMLTGINNGTFLLGYNMMGAYALSRGRKDLLRLGVVFPADYTLVLSRVAFVSKRATHPNAARLWLDYLLSARGQKVLGDAIELYPIRAGVKARFTAAGLQKAIGPAIRQVPLDMTLAAAMDDPTRSRILAAWRKATGQIAAAQ